MGMRVWALAIGGADPEVVRGQSRPPERVVTREELRAGAFDSPPDWLWVIDPYVRPAPGCLEALLDAAADRSPALVASLVESDDPLVEAVPRIDKEVEIAAAERGLVAIRALPTASFLVRPGAVDGALEQGRLFSYTARLLRDSPGYLAPGSTATVPGRAAGCLREQAATLATGAWRGPERVWFALRLARSALRTLA